MKQIFFLLGLSALLLIGCQDTDTKETLQSAKISKPLQTQLQKNNSTQTPTFHPSSTTQHSIANRGLGIVVKDGQIIIDTKQTKDFLHGIEQKMQKGFRRIEQNLRKEQISSPNETGIIITDTTLQIDLNKTRNFMEKWVRSMESVAEEIDDTLREIEQSLP